MKMPKHCDINAYYHGGTLEVSFDCSYELCRHAVEKTDDEGDTVVGACGRHIDSSCQSKFARHEAMKAFAKALGKYIKDFEEEYGL